MAPHYLYPCACGQTIPLTPAQAGEQVRCGACGKTQLAPTLSRLRALPAAESGATPARSGEPSWNRTQGALFVIGCGFLLVGLYMVSWNGLARRDLPTEMPPGATSEAWNERIDSFNLEETWQVWQEMREHRLEQQYEPEYMFARRIDEALRRKMWIGAGLSACGLVLVLGSLLLRPRRPATAGRTPAAR